MKKRIFILLLLWTTMICSAALANTVDPSNVDIRYTGRWDHSTPAPWAYWIGSSIIAKFTGTSISATLSASNTNYIRVIIDGNAADSVKIPISSGEQIYELATGLTADSNHTVEIVKETDAGRLTFHQFLLENEKGLIELPDRLLRKKISFYGDSNLAGYSLESEQNQSDQSLRGSYYGYAGITARMFGAEYENISRSGATLRSMNNAFDRIDYWSRDPAWDFNKFQPDVVVVNLGANDVGRPKNRIKSYYHAFLDDLRAVYPDAHIMLFNGWGWDYDEPANYTWEVIAERHNRGDTNTSYAIFPWVFEQWHGCEYDHAGMAQVLADHLSAVMGWEDDINSIDVMSGFGVGGDVANGSFEEVAPFGGFGWRYSTVDSGIDRIHHPAPDGAYDRNYYLRLESGKSVHQPNPAKDGQVVTVRVWMRGASNGDQARVTIDFRDQEMWTAPLDTVTETFNLTNGWEPHTVTATAPTGGSKPVYHTRLTLQAVSGDHVDFDSVVMSINDPSCPDPDETICDDGIDNDCDELIDCDDSDCSAFPVCVNNCGNGICDSGEDCITCPNDCSEQPPSEADCNDNIDNDCDGNTDCDDADCNADPACSCGAKKSPCTKDSQCCSNRCSNKGVCL
jgi:hypothetical protein